MKKKKSFAAALVFASMALALGACKSTAADPAVSQEKISPEKIEEVEGKEYAVQDISEDLKDSIVCIKNLETNFNEEETTAIILDKKGSVYLKTLTNTVKLEGTTKLKDITDAVGSPYEYGDMIIYDESGMYYISETEQTITEYELSKDLAEILEFKVEAQLCGIDKSGNGVTGVKEDTWEFIPSPDMRNVSFAGGTTLLIGDKLYSDSVLHGQRKNEADKENFLLLDNVSQVWGWDNLKLDRHVLAATNSSEYYLLETGLGSLMYKLELDEAIQDDTIQNVYFVSGDAYAKAIIVGTKNVYIVSSDYNDEMESIYKTEPLEGMSSYIDNIRGFYCEENKLFALLGDGNIYMVKDFLE